MLGLRLNLTTAQTETLLCIANQVLFRLSNNGPWVPEGIANSNWVVGVQVLIKKGLVQHNPRHKPCCYSATKEGAAIASLIEKECERFLDYRNRAGTGFCDQTGKTVRGLVKKQKARERNK